MARTKYYTEKAESSSSRKMRNGDEFQSIELKWITFFPKITTMKFALLVDPNDIYSNHNIDIRTYYGLELL